MREDIARIFNIFLINNKSDRTFQKQGFIFFEETSATSEMIYYNSAFIKYEKPYLNDMHFLIIFWKFKIFAPICCGFVRN